MVLVIAAVQKNTFGQLKTEPPAGSGVTVKDFPKPCEEEGFVQLQR